MEHSTVNVNPQQRLVMIDAANWTLEVIGHDAMAVLNITTLPGCWYITDLIKRDWCVVVTWSHTSQGTSHWALNIAQAEGEVMHLGWGGGPTRPCAVELSNRINDAIGQFVRL